MTPPPNPYVGPRTFTEQEATFFFGREREARDLTARIVSERLLLFYAQSGAGKSSLLNARIIPNLRDEEGFQVLPVGRVSGELPPGVGAAANIFAFNLMSSLDQSGEHAEQLARVSLSDFLARLVREGEVNAEGKYRPRWVYRPEIERPQAPGEGRQPVSGPRFALVIDQFEEIITSHPSRWREREAFFVQLNQALLDDPNLWVVLTLREDYVAALDPYAEICFNRLRARFYMERMKTEAALEAVQRPAEKAGRLFGPGVAQQLVDNLRQVRVPGQKDTVAGQYIEPVQLQVVCYQLWEGLAVGGVQKTEDGERQAARLITSADLARAGDVNRALTSFYEESLAVALREAAAAGLSERRLREWFDRELITEVGTRDTVFRNEVSGYTGSAPNAVVDVLARRFLLRIELRAGGSWVELVHDRLVRPVCESNASWSEQRLNALQRRAALWLHEGRPEEMLLKGDSLDEAERWAQNHAVEMEERDYDFLAASQRERAKADQLARQARRLRLLALSASALSILALVAALLAWRQSILADRARRDAYLAEQIALDKEAIALNAKDEAETQRALAETAEAKSRNAADAALKAKEDAENQRHLAETAADRARQVEKEAQTEAFAGAAIFELSRRRFDDAMLMAFAAGEQARQLSFDSSLVTHAIRRVFEESLPNTRLTQQGRRTSFTGWLDSDKRLLLAAGGLVTILDAKSNQTIQQFPTPERRLLAVDAAGERLLLVGTGSEQSTGKFEIWSLDQKKAILSLTGHKGQILSAAWSPDGTRVISGSSDQTARVWDALTGQELLSLSGHNGSVWIVDWSPDGTRAYTGAWDGASRLWDASSGELIATLAGPPNTTSKANAVDAVVWSPDDEAIYVGYDNAAIQAWYPATNRVVILPPVHADRIRSITLRPEAHGQFLSLGSDGLAVLWDSTALRRQFSWFACTSPGYSAGWEPAGNKLLIGCEDGTIRLWSLEERQDRQFLTGNPDWVWGVAWSPDGEFVATSGQDKTVRIWSAATGAQIAESERGERAGDYAQTLDVAWRPDNKEVLSGHYDGIARIWRPEDGKLLAKFAGHLAGSQGGIRSVAWNQDGTRFATGGGDGRVLIWDRTEVGVPPIQLAQLAAGVSAVAWSPDSHSLAFGGEDGLLYITSTETTSHILKLNEQARSEEKQRAVLSVAWGSDDEGERIAAGWSDGVLQIWDPYAQTLIREQQVASGGVEDVAWRPDGAMLVTGSWDGTARVWDAMNWHEITELEGHTAVIQSVDWSLDGSRIVTGSRDKTARIWIVENDLMLAALLRRICTGSVITDNDIRARIPTWTSCKQRLVEPELARLLVRYDSIIGR